ncbi:unnamed protein product [Ceratitis capitata]|uniref:(Mediterranean fruit fly) hypothetical protein n=1 Tax=Ceratitis capitata TaxID=7213 RepID=A0A811U200_CERCA|nr:unnamed protein product [Ceratitis capitata]
MSWCLVAMFSDSLQALTVRRHSAAPPHKRAQSVNALPASESISQAVNWSVMCPFTRRRSVVRPKTKV